MPDELKARVQEAAAASGRSLHAELLYRLQGSFDSEDEASTSEQRIGVSIGLSDPRDRAAILKAMLLDELMLLRRRVEDLGGREAVISASKAELAKGISGPRIQGTEEERQSYFSRIVETLPLTSVLTTTEIETLAKRVVQLHNLQKPHPWASAKSLRRSHAGGE
ncbi:MAG: Arc family DNA-binding protein [Proteobacteria bacterium]|nr:Arc family DNA-binding protein [Pseudomonadota bacterium]